MSFPRKRALDVRNLPLSTSGHVIGSKHFHSRHIRSSLTCYGHIEANPYPQWTLAPKVVRHSSLKTTLSILDIGCIRWAVTPL